MDKLNFGCGRRIAEGWTNIDFDSSDSRVKRVNLLNGFPFPDDHFDAVYSSHVIEHFTREEGLFLLTEANRVLKPGGILRVVVPDLAATCEEYLRILSLTDSDEQKAHLYEWIMIEMLDQLVRTKPSGEMGPFLQKLNANTDTLSSYVSSRAQTAPVPSEAKSLSFRNKLRKLTPQKLSTKLNYWYIKCVGLLIPKNLRSMVLIETRIGERHRWMYDLYGLSRLCEEAGFHSFRPLAYNESAIPHFLEDCLDSNPNGLVYKTNSIYLEASK